MFLGLFFGGSCANAQDQLVIYFSDGTSQTIMLDKPTSSIRSINFGGALAPTVSNDKIVVVSGTYGSNCGASYGNKTAYLSKVCNNRSHCEYTIDYQVIGDPVVGCGKDYIAEWRCGSDSTVHRTSAPPEAGFRKKVTLSCPR